MQYLVKTSIYQRPVGVHSFSSALQVLVTQLKMRQIWFKF